MKLNIKNNVSVAIAKIETLHGEDRFQCLIGIAAHVYPAQVIDVAHDELFELARLLGEGNRVAAVKYLREQVCPNRMSLRDAVDICDVLYSNRRDEGEHGLLILHGQRTFKLERIECQGA